MPLWSWLLFGGIVAVSLLLDLLAHRGGRSLGRKHAVTWSCVWIGAALGFAIWVAAAFGRERGIEFVTAYLIEKSLSVDNLFVFLVLFERLRIPATEQHRVLFWGIVGALVSRALFIAGGAALLSRWHEATYVLGAFLIYTGVKTLRVPKAQPAGRALALLLRYVPFTPACTGIDSSWSRMAVAWRRRC